MTRSSLKAGAMMASAALFTQAAVAQDDCATALPLTTDVLQPFDTTASTPSGVAWDCTFTTGIPDTWFTFTAAGSYTATISTCDMAAYDTRLEIFDGACGALTSVACNDDGPGCGGFTSEATADLVSGVQYWVRVGGFNAAATGTGDLLVTGPPPPPDTCDLAAPITPDVLESFDTTVATDSGVVWACTGNIGIQDVWYTFVATDSYMADFSTCGMADYDTRIEVFDGDCLTLNSILCNDDGPGCAGFSSFGTAPVVAGTQYWVRVGGFNAAASGTGQLLVSGPPPAVGNDECSGAIDLASLTPEMWDNTLATNSAGAPAWTCGGASANALDLWYQFTPLADGMVTVDTEGTVGDTRLAVYEGDCSALVEIDCDDDGGTGLLSSITFMGLGGTTYYARVAGFSGGVIGAGMITADYLDMLPNDDCDGATPVVLGMSTFTNSGAAAGTQDMSCVFNGELSDVWFSYTAGSSCPTTVDLSGSDYDTGMAIYEGDCMALVEVGCDDDGGEGLDSLITFDAVAGTTYLIQVGGFNGASGLGVMNITEEAGIGTFVCAGDANSTGMGATLTLEGSDLVADNDLTINVKGLPMDSMGFVITSQETNVVVNPGGSSGTLCIASFVIGRFNNDILDSGTTGTVTLSPDLTMFPTATLPGFEAVMAGETRYFQHWYRDVDGMGAPTSNFSSAQGLTFN